MVIPIGSPCARDTSELLASASTSVTLQRFNYSAGQCYVLQKHLTQILTLCRVEESRKECVNFLKYEVSKNYCKFLTPKRFAWVSTRNRMAKSALAYGSTAKKGSSELWKEVKRCWQYWVLLFPQAPSSVCPGTQWVFGYSLASP